jgi:hypothetical protein
LHDAILMEERGIPSTVVITEPFQTLVASNAAKLGAPGYHFLTVPHPVWGKDEEQLREVVRPIVAAALAQLTTAAG